MKTTAVTVRCRIDAKCFRKFAMFDTFRLKKRGRLPLLFMLIMLVFSGICFFSGKPQSWLPGVLLLLIGLGMPAVYVGTFLSGVNKQAKQLGMKTPRAMYTVVLRPEGVNIRNDYKAEENVNLNWDQIWGAVRLRGDVYLYATQSRAFILPSGQAEPDDGALWALLKASLPANKLTDKR